ncbi:MAG: cyclic pyranopterin monophosphate synthase MoaC [Candidatus Methanofastidiosa archaeon]|nr:cyclic pyranopterin monophosphate synthase MoaC [Candidatus Methanofastidiosa archaeon]
MALTHVNDKGVVMVDISGKGPSQRRALAEGTIILSPDTIALITSDGIRKGNVLATAQIAGIMAAKRTSSLIPLCHQVPLDEVSVTFAVHADRISASCEARTTHRTGVEMEALVGVSAALLAIWDMVKANEKDAKGQYPATAIEDIRVVRKEK